MDHNLVVFCIDRLLYERFLEHVAAYDDAVVVLLHIVLWVFK